MLSWVSLVLVMRIGCVFHNCDRVHEVLNVRVHDLLTDLLSE